jgi:cytochrome P450
VSAEDSWSAETSSIIVTAEPFQADPYAPFRQAGHVRATRDGWDFTLAVNYDEVKRIARDWRTFTSDTPFEVPIPHEHDVRGVRQLPIEVDPPRHTVLRRLVEDAFSHEGVEAHAPVVADVVDRALAKAGLHRRLDVVSEIALPVVNHALAATLGLPIEDVSLWLTWGTHVFFPSGSAAKRSNEALDAYLERIVDDALDGSGGGIFADVARADVDGRRLTRDEVLGFANLMFAGGRDTVVGGIVNMFIAVAHLPAALAWVREHPRNARTAVEEILRIQAPLSYIGRHATEPATVGGSKVDHGDLVALGFGAANRDPSAFDDADSCRLDRRPNRHIAFGHGPHTCLGAHLARMEMRVTLERLAAVADAVEFVEPFTRRHLDVGGQQVVTGFDHVVVSLSKQ